MGGLSNRELLTAPFALTGAMLVIAVVTDTMARIDNSMLLWPYLASSVAVTVLCLLCSVFWWVLRLAVQRADAPVGAVMARLRSNWVPLLLPAIPFPLFLASYTRNGIADLLLV